MKKFALYFAFVALLCTLAVAHEGHKMIKGKVIAVNGQEIQVQVENGPKQTVTVMPDTKILKGDDDMKLSDVKVGDGVFVHGPEKDGKIQAEEIRIRIPHPGTTSK
jgi:uncharacterized ubiquitin-like protein YukD